MQRRTLRVTADAYRWPRPMKMNLAIPLRLLALAIGSATGCILEGILFLFVFLRLGYIAQLRFGRSDPQIDSVYPAIGVITIYVLELVTAGILGSLGAWLLFREKATFRGLVWSGAAIGIVIGVFTHDPAFFLLK